MERHRHSHFFGNQLALVISGQPSRFPSQKSAENYFSQVKQTISTEGEVGGRGYAGEVLCALLSNFPETDISLLEIINCTSLADLSSLFSLKKAI